MTIQIKTVNFGKNRANATGSSGVGVTLQDVSGNTVLSRSTENVYQSLPDSGLYCAQIDFPDDFHGCIIWDTAQYFSTTSYAIEEYNVEANDPRILQTLQSMKSSINLLVDMSAGRWKIENNKMIFFGVDNDVPVATFDLFDDKGIPSSENVFERRRA